MKDKFNGWHYVAMLFIVATTIVVLVMEGEALGAIVGAVTAILAVLGYNTAQNKTNNDLANGRLTELQRQLAEQARLHSDEMARKDSQFSLERATLQTHIKEANDKAAMYAAMAPPEAKVE